MKDKIDFLQSVVGRGGILKFDYVSADMKVSFGKQVVPKEVKKPYLYAEDVLANNMLKRYVIDGIQKASFDGDDGYIIEFIEEV